MRIWRTVTLAICCLCLMAASGCRLTGGSVHFGKSQPRTVATHTPPPAKGGPPPHAKAHGYRAKHKYHYYPREEVYFDPGRGMYFFLDGRNWRMSASLPGSLQINLSRYVTIEMEHERPYVEYEQHKVKYPKDKDSDKKKKKG
jgi:hypothetical protein